MHLSLHDIQAAIIPFLQRHFSEMLLAGFVLAIVSMLIVATQVKNADLFKLFFAWSRRREKQILSPVGLFFWDVFQVAFWMMFLLILSLAFMPEPPAGWGQPPQ